MEEENLTSANGFLIIGFADFPQLHIPLFVSFLLIYLASLLGNFIIMTTIYSNSQLHTPMYFFLTNLSFLDIGYTSVIFPPMLVHFFGEGMHVSLTVCLLQMYFFTLLALVEIILLSVMALDRYVAICNPLRYMTVMNNTVCIGLAAGSWAIGIVDTIPHTALISRLHFCKSHRINHFFCDVTAMMKISCSSTYIIETLTYILGSIHTIMSFLLIILSYIQIVSSILKIRSKEGRHKASSTCASHLTVVILFYGSLCFAYMRPTSTYSTMDNKILSLSYIAVTPLCNPIIYSLKNTEMKNALMKRKKK